MRDDALLTAANVGGRCVAHNFRHIAASGARTRHAGAARRDVALLWASDLHQVLRSVRGLATGGNHFHARCASLGKKQRRVPGDVALDPRRVPAAWQRDLDALRAFPGDKRYISVELMARHLDRMPAAALARHGLFTRAEDVVLRR